MNTNVTGAGSDLLPTQTADTGTTVIEETDDLFDYAKAKVRHTQIIGQWSQIRLRAAVNRERRKVEYDTADMRRTGELAPDETMIATRTIDKNIRREQPPYVNYLRNSRRVATFSNVNDRKANTERLEEDYTRGVTYSGWEIPFYKELDGSQLHGWDAIEVTFDTSKPLHVGFEHVGHDKLIFPIDSLNIQTAEVLIREYSVTILELNIFVRQFGFSNEQVSKIKSMIQTNPDQKNLTIYKRFCKKDGVVYVSWFAQDYGVNDWLKPPAKLFLGRAKEVEVPTDPSILAIAALTQTAPPPPTTQIIDEDEELYPIFILPYNETEDLRVIDHDGRGFLDYPTQEATTALWSSIVNMAVRSAGMYASPKKDSDGGKLKSLDVRLEPGSVYNQAMDFWTIPQPGEALGFLAQQIDVEKSAEAGQTNYAVANKRGSRNTAEEIKSANKDQQLLTSVQLTLFSTHIRDVHTFAWRIVQSRALLGYITFLVDPATGMNDIATIGQTYEIRAAGDIDVIQRQEKLALMQTFWPVIQTFPALAIAFLQDMLKIAFPDSGEKYSALLDANNPDVMLIGGLLTLLQGALDPEDVAGLTPQQQQQMQMLMQAAQMRVAQANGQQPMMQGNGGGNMPMMQGGDNNQGMLDEGKPKQLQQQPGMQAA